MKWDDNAATPPLAELRQMLEADPRLFWRMGCGHHLNALDMALEEIDRLQAEALPKLQLEPLL